MKVDGTSVVLRRQRGSLVLQLMNRTPRGVKYIKREVVMKEKSTRAPGFKANLAADVMLLLESGETTT